MAAAAAFQGRRGTPPAGAEIKIEPGQVIGERVSHKRAHAFLSAKRQEMTGMTDVHAGGAWDFELTGREDLFPWRAYVSNRIDAPEIIGPGIWAFSINFLNSYDHNMQTFRSNSLLFWVTHYISMLGANLGEQRGWGWPAMMNHDDDRGDDDRRLADPAPPCFLYSAISFFWVSRFGCMCSLCVCCSLFGPFWWQQRDRWWTQWMVVLARRGSKEVAYRAQNSMSQV